MGVYQIQCVPENKLYIGSSTNVASRLKQHVFHLRNGSHYNRRLQADWDRHGATAFEFEMLEEVPCGSDLLAIENEWIVRVRPAYNNRPPGGRFPSPYLNLKEDTRDAAPIPILDRA